MPPSTQVVRNEGPFRGLPTYPENVKDLTAIVTGANGMSGYHMVRVLASAPERWRRIYCLSRRPPPANFFEDLGDGAKLVEHISVDFLSSEEDIVRSLQGKVEKVDYVFFFSYMQPKQKGGTLNMWSDAEELATINGNLIRNFLGGLKGASLIPKRFMLQTGAKHYGFHIGPATNPSFESDPRIEVEANFYYPQEDALSTFCKDTGSSWNVVRPSYIIGAVRDSALNHMVGLAIYGAVQAHRGLPLAFPGDYAAWDRECCQSTALLNARLEEWVALTSDAANEAFNVQDGTAFTWGRFWPYLARWFSTTWTPPEVDESKYRVTVSRWPQPPRGYGPKGVTRSTFSLLEWSGEPEVQTAWSELAKKHHLALDPFTDVNRPQIFSMTDSAVIGGWALSLSMRKARHLGFHATADSFETAFNTIRELGRLKVVPPPSAASFE